MSKIEAGKMQHLDLLSTSQNVKVRNGSDVSQKLLADVEFEIEQSLALQEPICDNHAPFIFFIDATGRGRLVQGCCNNWLCKRCGHIRARSEYGRIVNGANELALAGHKLYFHTITCRGKDMSLEDAERGYAKWTNKLLSTMRARCKKQGDFWAYAQVTERQQRQHPHSHFISTFLPDDAIATVKQKTKANGEIEQREIQVSKWFIESNRSAGLGDQCEITVIINAVAVAVYVSKYLFKDAIATHWPKGWKRVRYSQNWPDLEFPKSELAFPVVTANDWRRLAYLGMTVYCDSQHTLERSYAHLCQNTVFTGDNGYRDTGIQLKTQERA